MEDKRINLIVNAIEKYAYNEEQKQLALKELEQYKPKINKVISVMVYNKDFGKQISILTTPDFNLKFDFKKRIN